MAVIQPTGNEIESFRAEVLARFAEAGRDLPWRHDPTPYRVFVSEVMLQQTRASRVAGFFPRFIDRFPDFCELARAPLSAMVAAWQGLGYNRRALNLHRAAGQVVERFGGRLPDDPGLLATLPGIGPATAASIAAFAFGRPTVFLETNIRAALIHRFFPGRDRVDDAELLPIAKRALDRSDPARWYNALMDFGADVKRAHANPARRSAAYARQAPFEGSERQLRGAVLKSVIGRPGRTAYRLAADLGFERTRVALVCAALEREGFLVREGRGRYRVR